MAAAAAGESLRGRSLPELRETLRRQEKLLGDRKFISRLPDRGKKISDLVEKLKIAIAEKADSDRTTELLSAVRREFQKKQEAIESSKQNNFASNKSVQKNPSRIVESPAVNLSRERAEEALAVSSVTAGNKKVTEIPTARTSGEAQRAPGVLNVAEAGTVATGYDEELSEAFGRISIGGRAHEEGFDKGESVRSKTNPFQKVPKVAPKSPHYIEVLEMRAKNPVSKRSKFKTNVLASESRSSSGGSPETPSPGGPSSVTAEERRRRDRKHLDDVTAARVPPLHHAPTKLLAIEESIAIQVQQKVAYEEMQAKLAAQKLAEKLGIQMDRYEPEGEVATGYKEVKDEGEGYSSAED